MWRSKTKILTTRMPPSWIEFDFVTSQRQTQSASNCVMLLELISWDCQMIFSGFYKRSINAGTIHGNQQSQVIFKMSRLTLWRHNVKLNPRLRRPSFYLLLNCSKSTVQKTCVWVLVQRVSCWGLAGDSQTLFWHLIPSPQSLCKPFPEQNCRRAEHRSPWRK